MDTIGCSIKKYGQPLVITSMRCQGPTKFLVTSMMNKCPTLLSCKNRQLLQSMYGLQLLTMPPATYQFVGENVV